MQYVGEVMSVVKSTTIRCDICHRPLGFTEYISVRLRRGPSFRRWVTLPPSKYDICDRCIRDIKVKVEEAEDV